MNKLYKIALVITMASGLATGPSMAQEAVRIGFLSDLSGPSAAINGPGSVPAIEMAIEDFGGKVLGKPIELLVADMLNKPDTGLGIAREWVDVKNVSAILDINNSAVALAVNKFLKERKRTFLDGGATTRLTNADCSPYLSQWIPDTYSLAYSLALPVVKNGNDKWFFITVDYAFGHDLEAKGIAAVKAAGGEVMGAVRHSPQTKDYSAFLLEAQAKGANTIGLATFGSYMINIVKQANEFGLKVKLVPFFISVPDIVSAGAENLQNVTGTTAWYWDANDTTRAFNARYQKRADKAATYANVQQYSAVLHYLKAVKKANTLDADKVAEAMRSIPVEDTTGISAYVRKDGRVMRNMFLVDVKKPEDIKGKYDVMNVVAEIDKEKINQPLSESTCPLVK